MGNNLRELKEELGFLRFKKLFLLEFTRQLIENSSHAEIIKLQTILEKEKAKETKEEKVKISANLERISEINKEEEESKGTRSIMHPSVGMFGSQETPEANIFGGIFKKEPQIEITKRPYRRDSVMDVKTIRRTPRGEYYLDPFKKLELWVPEPRLPEHIQYLRPTPINKIIDLGKLNPLIRDPFVKTIECQGPGQNLIVKGRMGIKRTATILNKEEINEIIEKFSRDTKIPAHEGVFKVVSGRLIFMAIISEVAESKFTINKMPAEQQTQTD